MSLKSISLVLLAATLTVSACSSNTRARAVAATDTSTAPVVKVSNALQIGDERFPVSLKTYGTGAAAADVWVVEVDGLDYSCESGDPMGCMMTVSNAQSGDLIPILPVK